MAVCYAVLQPLPNLISQEPRRVCSLVALSVVNGSSDFPMLSSSLTTFKAMNCTFESSVEEAMVNDAMFQKELKK